MEIYFACKKYKVWKQWKYTALKFYKLRKFGNPKTSLYSIKH